MPSFDKKTIAKKFSAAAKNYDEHAAIQAIAAQELCEIVTPFIKENSAILDLGSGTSFIAKKFCNKKNIKFFEVDIAENMLKHWKKRPLENFVAIQADIEKLPFKPKSFDIIISSFSLQWLTNFEENFAHFFSLLKADGIFAFCLPGQETFAEVRAASVESGCNFNFIDLPEIENLKSALIKSGFSEKILYKKNLQQKFNSGSEALKSLQKIGANISQKKTALINKSKLMRFNNFCLKNSNSTNKTFIASWNVPYFLFSKQND